MMLSLKSPSTRTAALVGLVTFFFLATLISWEYHPRTLVTSLKPHAEPQWLLAIFTGPATFVRRDIIRSTWASRYQHIPYEFRFILGNYTSNPWASLIEAENATYGDIWAIDDFQHETGASANNNKNMYFFNYMKKFEGTRIRRYDFVSKVDDDIWFNIPQYYEAFMAPRLPRGPQYNSSELTWIGRPMHWDREYCFPSGRIYTISWPMLRLFAEKYTANPKDEYSEDQMMGYYLYENRTPHKFVAMELEQAWDIGLESIVSDKNETMIIHSVKNDKRLIEISTIFDREGLWNGKKINGLTSYNRTMEEVIDRIGDPSGDELEKLRQQWRSRSDGENDLENKTDPKDTLDWKLIRKKINIESREEMGTMFPLNLPGNNASTGIVPNVI